MQPIAAVFRSRDDAEKAALELRWVRFDDERINLLTPESSESTVHSVETSASEQQGMGATFGGVLGGALGLASGFGFGLATTAMIPGVGPVAGVGAAAAALLAAAGAVGGAKIGSAVETKTTEGLPADEIFFYEDALRHGRSVVIAMAENEGEAEWARDFFDRARAETVDAAREAWWIGLRDAEEEHYRPLGDNLDEAEGQYRTGFVAALRRDLRGKSYVAAMDYLKDGYPEIWRKAAFRKGFERGQVYLRECQGGPAPR
jgi:hypothetical protein